MITVLKSYLHTICSLFCSLKANFCFFTHYLVTMATHMVPKIFFHHILGDGLKVCWISKFELYTLRNVRDISENINMSYFGVISSNNSAMAIGWSKSTQHGKVKVSKRLFDFLPYTRIKLQGSYGFQSSILNHFDIHKKHFSIC